MAEQQSGVLLHLRQLLDTHAAKNLSDGQLLAQFAAERDEAAFAALMQRHGPLVYGVCRHVLGHEHDAEDAFQGTFLVLARRAESIRRQNSVAGWLHGVAYRVALKARQSAARRRERESQAARPESERLASEHAWRELQAILDEELQRLGEKYRTPFVLCVLQGKSKSEAARELDWKEGTVSSRLAQARKVLQTRLARRGVTLSAVLCGLEVAKEGAGAAVPALVFVQTLRAALAFVAGQAVSDAANAVALAEGLLQSMASRFKVGAAVLVAILLAGTATVLYFRPPPESSTPQFPEAPKNGPDVVEAPKAEQRVQEMTVNGRVVGPDGKPLPGARVAVVAAEYPRAGEFDRSNALGMKLFGEGSADAQGQFRLTVPQATGEHYRLNAIASAPGFALSSSMADPGRVTASEHSLPVQLVPAQSIRARLIDQKGHPAGGVEIHVLGMARGGASGVFLHYSEPPVPLPGWPNPVTTDDEGYFTLHGIGPHTQTYLQVRDVRFATQWLTLSTGMTEKAEATVLRALPPRVLEGRIIAEDTGLPLAGVTVVAQTTPESAPILASRAEGQTDKNGRFTVRPFPGKSYEVWVYPPSEMPYLVVSQRLQWPAGAVRHKSDLSLPRGVLVRGQVAEADSGKPVAGAAIKYESSLTRHPRRPDPSTRCWTRDARTRPDGCFELAVFDGTGHLLVKAATPDFIPVETNSGVLLGGKEGGTPYFPDALLPLQLAPAAEPQVFAIALRRGVTLRGRVLRSDGRPVASGLLFTPNYMTYGMESKGHPVLVRAGRFELPGCDPGGSVPVWIFDPDSKQGAQVKLPARSKDEPEVRLAPCVSAQLRLLDLDRKPVTRPKLMVELVLRPGDDINESLQMGTQVRLTVRSPMLYGSNYEPTESKEGWLTLPHLIPGATYLVRAQEQLGWPTKTTFQAPHTGVTQLGEVVISPRVTGADF